ncbi:hypothetical protein GCM10009624_14700 [Gordonia sinesedis]
MSQLLFVHGADGYTDDGPLAEALATHLGARLRMPQLPDDDKSVTAWTGRIAEALGEIGADDVVIGHSFGASMLLHALAQASGPLPATATLLAMPDWGSGGWAVDEYTYTGPTLPVALSMHHCADDTVVPVDHLTQNAHRFPTAWLRSYPHGGHQFDGLAQTIAADITDDSQRYR